MATADTSPEQTLLTDRHALSGRSAWIGDLLLPDWRRFVPETMALVLPLVYIDVFFLNADGFASIYPRPFWIPVLLISAQYGLAGGMFASLVSTIALYSIALPPQLATQDFYDYSRIVVAEPAAWLTATLVLGGLRSLHMVHARELREQLDEANAMGDAAEQALAVALGEIKRLELRIAGDTHAIGGVAQALAGLDARSGPQLMASFSEVVRQVVGASTLTLYRADRGGATPLVRIGGSGDLDAAPALSSELVDAMVRGRRTIRADERGADHLLPRGGTIAAPICAPHDAVVWGIALAERLDGDRDLSGAALAIQSGARGLAALIAGNASIAGPAR
ncbi:hypothetical protein [Methylobacterium soli]|uniref:GAF domain-containing protein n=1 Tax=Methylobacterium soli TaxID=553447 RepID=A0A6L3T965_9HYPH|nr:hypothetical protein [Methylobacterium soli]KAB1080269.1 hypothetical protein F6X53_06085 [Methylobacterium soli]GJE46580.1 hypothetical protein AEGHOMDF_5786 [Methylobacterium soli]